MKPTSPLSLLLFLHLVSGIPIPIKHSSFTSDCQYSSCTSRTALILLKPSTPPTTLTEPHFPSHQLSANPDSDEAFSNTPLTPPATLPPSAALTAKHPLSSSYLLSLSSSTTNPLPSKPTSALPLLRKEDEQRYWASLRAEAGLELQSSQTVKLCGSAQHHYLKIKGAYLTREYSDLMVVGIVVIFLVVVVALEMCERVGDLRSILCGTRRRRGEIYLEDDDTDMLFVVRTPFSLQPAPAPRHKTASLQKENWDEDADTEVEVEGCDSHEKV